MNATRCLLCGLLVLSACGPAPRSTITLGAVMSTTGDLANTGREQLDAITLAVEQINAAGGVLGADLALATRDDGTEETRARVGAQALADTNVPVIFGGTGSAISLAMAEVTVGKPIVQISASATSPQLTTFADNNFLFRTCASDANQGLLLARRARAKGLTRVAVLHIPDAYGTGLAGAFRAAFTAAGGTVTFEAAYTEGQSSYAAQLTALYASTPEAVLLVAYAVDGAQIIVDYLSTFSTRNTFWLFTDGLEDPAFITAAGGPSRFTFSHEGTGPGTPTGPRFDSYKTAFKTRFGHDVGSGNFSANAYDAVYLTALAIEAAGKADATSIRDQLAAVSSGGTAYAASDFAAAAAAARAKSDVDYDGASGNVDLDAAGEVNAPYDVWKVTAAGITITEQSVEP